MDLDIISLSLAAIWTALPPIVTRWIGLNLALIGSALTLFAVWLLNATIPVGIGVCVGVLLALWVDHRRRLRCPGCGKAVRRADTLCDDCQGDFRRRLRDNDPYD